VAPAKGFILAGAADFFASKQADAGASGPSTSASSIGTITRVAEAAPAGMMTKSGMSPCGVW